VIDNKNCANCGRELKRKQRSKWCSQTCYGKYIRKKKKRFLESVRLNSSCSFCGYKEHPEILQFHHLVPLKRKWAEHGDEILRSARCGNIKRIKEELKKVILLCPNCHRWLHYKN